MNTHPSLPYVLPFAAFLVFLSLDGKLGIPPEVEYPLRVVLLSLLLWFVSRRVISLRAPHWSGSILLGILVFVVWIAPDTLAPTWRKHWLFANPILGAAPVPASGYASLPWHTLLFRAIRAVILVPIVEELFWRAWLMRWLIRPEFESVPLGQYSAQAFWIVAVLFALEHGSYWEVGFLAGVAYNWWMVKTKSLGDCILAHAVTNLCLSAYVWIAGKWQYW
ncbi:MAG: CAAX prenyl protease-related protein [Bryobacteraceae bacterium]|nr:CAAX prenyl protease-related protein [Bryobacteraceae bacterium]MDW8379314.1 CAAX prenyl protease-related protein [Bryobacterales bacterium]